MGKQGFSMEEVMRLMKTPAGQQLVKMLQTSNDPALKKAKEHAANGNIESAKEVLQQLSTNEELRKLISQLGGQHG